MTLAALGAAQAKPPSRGILVWSTKSSGVSDSTVALSNGNYPRAIKLATGALENAAGVDRVVALHNLCLSHLHQGDTEAAAPHCNAALAEAPVSLNAKTMRRVLGNIEQTRATQTAESDGK